MTYATVRPSVPFTADGNTLPQANNFFRISALIRRMLDAPLVLRAPHYRLYIIDRDVPVL